MPGPCAPATWRDASTGRRPTTCGGRRAGFRPRPTPTSQLAHPSAGSGPQNCTGWLLGALFGPKSSPDLRQVATWRTSQPEKGSQHAPGGHLVRPPTGGSHHNLHRVATWRTFRPEKLPRPAPSSLLAHLPTGGSRCNLHQVASWRTSPPEMGSQHAPGGHLVRLSTGTGPPSRTERSPGAGPYPAKGPGPAPTSLSARVRGLTAPRMKVAIGEVTDVTVPFVTRRLADDGAAGVAGDDLLDGGLVGPG